MNSTSSVDQDKAAIIEVLNLYAFALDARQWDLFDRVFAEDVEADFGPAGAAWSGLAGMRDRAHWLGGRLTIDTAPGRGTRVRAELPMQTAAR